jgi:hypothetical protein
MAVQRCHGIREETRFFCGSDPGSGFGFFFGFGLVLFWFFFKNIFPEELHKIGSGDCTF